MDSTEPYFRGVMDGSNRSAGAMFLRGATALAEPVYAMVMRIRNRLYDSGILRSHPLGRPTISVGNLTTGGTGKTPVVYWLAQTLARAGQRPAILLRGYKSSPDGISDEAAMLEKALGKSSIGLVPVIVDGNRVRGASNALEKHPEITLFILDDAMQHRRAARDFELVLINARDPFGHGHVLPRGLLREPLSGLRRAGVILITHAGEVDEAELKRIETTIQRHNPTAPMFRANHAIENIRGADERELPFVEFSQTQLFAFCGIGSPRSFFAQVNSLGGKCTGTKAFADHHHYTSDDLSDLQSQAAASGAVALLTTEKDWSKLCRLPGSSTSGIPIFRAQLALRFWDEHESALLRQLPFGQAIPLA